MTPQIIAHRGASYLAPENTLTAFKKAMEIGADGVEMDVQQTIDAGLVIHHDYMIDLHTDISGKIYDMTMGDLKTLDFGSWKDVLFKDEKIATLQEAMELCRQMPGCTVHLELKSTMDNDPDFVPRVIEEIRAADITDRLVVISFNHDLLRQAKALMPELRVGVLLYGAFESMVLPQKEFMLLYKMASFPGRIFTRQQLMDDIWGYDSSTDTHTVDVHIARLRERFRDNPDFKIVTMRGVGYKVVRT